LSPLLDLDLLPTAKTIPDVSLRTRKYRHVVAAESTRSTQNKLWLRS
jgi:hypothetical protein